MRAELQSLTAPTGYADDLLISLLPKKVVSGDTKDSYMRSSYKHGGIKTTYAAYALEHKFLYYSTTFKKNGKPYQEIIKTFIIDVDYKFEKTLDQAHKFVTDNIMPPTFSTETNKGYQFIFGLSAPFILTAAGEAAAHKFNQMIINAFTANNITVDMNASTRLQGTFRNPIEHNYRWHNKLWNTDEIHNRLSKYETRSHSTVIGDISANINSNALDQAQIIKTGYKPGNRNNYFYLHANKACVTGNIKSYNEALMICRNVASAINAKDPIPDGEIRATAKKLWNYKEQNKLFMPSVFCTGQKKNSGKYRLELNATVGYTTMKERRAASAKLVHRDRSKNTKQKIMEAIASMDESAFVLKGNQRINSIYKRIADASGVSSSTIARHHKKDPATFSSSLMPEQTKKSYGNSIEKKQCIRPYDSLLCKAPYSGHSGGLEAKNSDIAKRVSLLSGKEVTSVIDTGEEIVIDFEGINNFIPIKTRPKEQIQ